MVVADSGHDPSPQRLVGLVADFVIVLSTTGTYVFSLLSSAKSPKSRSDVRLAGQVLKVAAPGPSPLLNLEMRRCKMGFFGNFLRNLAAASTQNRAAHTKALAASKAKVPRPPMPYFSGAPSEPSQNSNRSGWYQRVGGLKFWDGEAWYES